MNAIDHLTKSYKEDLRVYIQFMVRHLCTYLLYVNMFINTKFHSYRENLTSLLPALECRHLSSDDDGLSTDGMDSIYDTADEEENEEYALTFDLPGRHR